MITSLTVDPDKLKSEIGLRLRAIREVNNLSQLEFAEKIGAGRLAYRNWETGRNWPDIPAMVIVCEKFHVDFNWIFDGLWDGLPPALAVKLSRWIDAAETESKD